MSADGGGSGLGGFSSAPSADELAAFPRNDLGNAQRLVRMVGGRWLDDGTADHTDAVLLYLRNRGWIAYNGRFWDLKAGEDMARRMAHRVAAALGSQTVAACEHHRIPAALWLEFVTRSGNSGSTSAMLNQAASYLTVDLEDFDRDPLAVNVANGTLKFDRKDGAWGPSLHPHVARDRITRMAETAYDKGAKRPLFDGLLKFSQPSEEMRDFLQALLGYCVTGSTREQLFVILQGKGGDGKSTMMNAIRAAIGTYSAGASIETFLDTGLRRANEASPDLARLAGDTRLVSTGEPPRGSKLATAAIKTWTGEGTVQARELRQSFFEFTPKGKVVMECNQRPAINDTDDGIWRRMRIVLFERQVPKADMDKGLPEKLKGERAGILNWLLDGIGMWLENGLKSPAAVDEALEDYRRGSNPFADWLHERVVFDPESVVPAGIFFRSYKDYCEANGVERPMSQTTFGKALGDHQILLAGKDSKGNKRRRGARIRPDHEFMGSDEGASPGGSVASGARGGPPLDDPRFADIGPDDEYRGDE